MDAFLARLHAKGVAILKRDDDDPNAASRGSAVCPPAMRADAAAFIRPSRAARHCVLLDGNTGIVMATSSEAFVNLPAEQLIDKLLGRERVDWLKG